MKFEELEKKLLAASVVVGSDIRPASPELIATAVDVYLALKKGHSKKVIAKVLGMNTYQTTHMAKEVATAIEIVKELESRK